MIQLAVFLGSPGKKLADTRHNTAWMLTEHLPAAASISWREKFHGRIAETHIHGKRIRLLMPRTFMNRSGESVAAALRFYRIPPGELLIVHDDIELAFGTVTPGFGGTTAGHNGLRSIRLHLGTGDFHRLRIGIGRPPRGTVRSWVLGRFDPVQQAALPGILDRGIDHLLSLIGCSASG